VPIRLFRKDESFKGTRPVDVLINRTPDALVEGVPVVSHAEDRRNLLFQQVNTEGDRVALKVFPSMIGGYLEQRAKRDLFALALSLERFPLGLKLSGLVPWLVSRAKCIRYFICPFFAFARLPVVVKRHENAPPLVVR